MKIGDRVQVTALKFTWDNFTNKPSVALRLVDCRAAGKAGVILERADLVGWWIVVHDAPTGQGAVYHESELTQQSAPTKYVKVEPEGQPEHSFRRPLR